MRILLDTNVLLDYLQQRKGFDVAEQILQECIQYKINQFLIHIETKNKNGWEKIMISYETIFEKISQIEGASN